VARARRDAAGVPAWKRREGVALAAWWRALFAEGMDCPLMIAAAIARQQEEGQAAMERLARSAPACAV
jgi:hypothetical protein